MTKISGKVYQIRENSVTCLVNSLAVERERHRHASVVSLKYLYRLSGDGYDLAHAEHELGDQFGTGGMGATGKVGIRIWHSTTGSAALPDYLGSLGGPGQCVDRRASRREPADSTAVAQ